MGAKFSYEPLRERTDELCNPRRGWYEIYSFEIDKEPDFEELQWCLRKNQTLALLLWNLGAVRSTFLRGEHLDRVDRTLRFFEDAGKHLIVRFAYDTTGDGLQREPSDFKLILYHISQLGRILKANETGIYVVQGVLIGSWGEMHHTSYGTKEHVRMLVKAMRAAVGSKIVLALRKPVHLRYLSEEDMERIGLFNDGLFGSDTHLATYGEKPRRVAAWDEMWSAEDEVVYTSRVCERASHGGEVVKGVRTIPFEEVVETMRMLRISYLNYVYDGRLLEKWRKMPVREPGVWQNRTWFDYIGAHLGYRFVITDVTVKNRLGKKSVLEVGVKNTGFAPLYENASVRVYANGDLAGEEMLPAPFPANREYHIRCTIPTEPGNVIVSLRLCQDDAPILIATEGTTVCENGVVIGSFQ